MTITNSENELVVTKKQLQDNLKKTIKSIDKELRHLSGGATTATFKTAGNFKYNELDGNTINILTCPELPYLLKSLALMYRIKKEYQETAEVMGIKSYPVVAWFGVPVDNWINDLEIRVKLIGNALRINKLNETKKKLEGFLSEEERLAATLKEVQDLIKGDI